METDPIQYPHLKIDGVDYELKFRVGDIIRLKKSGIDIGEAVQFKGVEAFERTMQLLSAAIAHQAAKTAEELADLIDLADVPKVSQALTDALKKATPQATTAPATVQ